MTCPNKKYLNWKTELNYQILFVCELPHSGLSRLWLVLCTVLCVVRVDIISGRYSSSSWEKLWAIHTGNRA